MLSCLACCGLVCKDNREKMGLMGPVMIRMAYMPLYIEKSVDLVTDLVTPMPYSETEGRTICPSDKARPGLHKLWYPGIRDRSTWGKFGAHGEHGDVFLFSNLGAL